MTTETPILEVDGVGKSFGDRVVLKSAGFTLWPGRITLLMGRNGVGKTTLFRATVGLVRPEYGFVRFRGVYRGRPRLSELAQDGLMFSAQESALTRTFTVRDHLVAMGRAWGRSAALDPIIDVMGIEPVLDQWSYELSGGERQRVSLALAMVREPECLIMDEPFVGIAPIDVPVITRGLQALRERGTAIGVSGHDVRELFAVSDEVIWMVAGTTHWIGTPDDARAHHQFRREYLGPRAGMG